MAVEEFNHEHKEPYGEWSTIYSYVEAYVEGDTIRIRAQTDANDYAPLDKEAAIRLRDWLNIAIEVL